MQSYDGFYAVKFKINLNTYVLLDRGGMKMVLWDTSLMTVLGVGSGLVYNMCICIVLENLLEVKYFHK